MENIKRMAYWIWRSLPVGFDLDDVQSEAVLGALQARPGYEVVAAKRAIITYLRRERPGSRGTRRMCMNTVWWLPKPEANAQERQAINSEMREKLQDAVALLNLSELKVIQAIFYEEQTQREAAKQLGTSEFYLSRLKSKAIVKLREAMVYLCHEKQAVVAVSAAYANSASARGKRDSVTLT